MKAFEYAAPRSEAEVLEQLSPELGESELLAGGTDLMGLMKNMVVAPDRVVSIMEVPSIQQVEAAPRGGVRIGSAVTLDRLLESPYLADYPAVTQAIRGISSMQLQAQGTLGGEIRQRPRCWYFRNGRGLLADAGRAVLEGDSRYHAIFGNSGPAKFVCGSRIAPALIALGAQARVLGPRPQDERWWAIEDLYRTPRMEGQRETTLAPDQWVTHVAIPPAAGRCNATYEVRHGEGPEYPLAAAAAALRIEGGFVRQAKVVLGQVAPIPWVSLDASQAILGLPVDAATAEAAGRAAVATATPLADNQYKVQLAKTAVKRALLRAAGLETGGF